MEKNIYGRVIPIGTRVVKFLKLYEPIPKTLDIEGYEVKIIYTGQDEALKKQKQSDASWGARDVEDESDDEEDDGFRTVQRRRKNNNNYDVEVIKPDDDGHMPSSDVKNHLPQNFDEIIKRSRKENISFGEMRMLLNQSTSIDQLRAIVSEITKTTPNSICTCDWAAHALNTKYEGYVPPQERDDGDKNIPNEIDKRWNGLYFHAELSDAVNSQKSLMAHLRRKTWV